MLFVSVRAVNFGKRCEGARRRFRTWLTWICATHIITRYQIQWDMRWLNHACSVNIWSSYRAHDDPFPMIHKFIQWVIPTYSSMLRPCRCCVVAAAAARLHFANYGIVYWIYVHPICTTRARAITFTHIENEFPFRPVKISYGSRITISRTNRTIDSCRCVCVLFVFFSLLLLTLWFLLHHFDFTIVSET